MLCLSCHRHNTILGDICWSMLMPKDCDVLSIHLLSRQKRPWIEKPVLRAGVCYLLVRSTCSETSKKEITLLPTCFSFDALEGLCPDHIPQAAPARPGCDISCWCLALWLIGSSNQSPRKLPLQGLRRVRLGRN